MYYFYVWQKLLFSWHCKKKNINNWNYLKNIICLLIDQAKWAKYKLWPSFSWVQYSFNVIPRSLFLIAALCILNFFSKTVDMSGLWEHFTWDWQELPWIASSTWSHCTMITESWRYKTEKEVHMYLWKIFNKPIVALILRL